MSLKGTPKRHWPFSFSELPAHLQQEAVAPVTETEVATTLHLVVGRWAANWQVGRADETGIEAGNERCQYAIWLWVKNGHPKWNPDK